MIILHLKRDYILIIKYNIWAYYIFNISLWYPCCRELKSHMDEDHNIIKLNDIYVKWLIDWFFTFNNKLNQCN
jgi:hypothetical protein